VGHAAVLGRFDAEREPELACPPQHLSSRVVRLGAGQAGAAPEGAPVEGLGSHRLVECGDREPGVADGAAGWPELVKGVDDRID
jgi:hypothetical protein